jgi:uncharacterized repeat protein (TIGR03943 family)
MNLKSTVRWAGLPDWIETFALGLWGALFLYYWRTGKLGLLIHPNYFGLTIASGFVLLAIAFLSLLKIVRHKAVREPHQTLFPPGLMSTVLLAAAIVGLVFTPRPFASQIAIQRGLQDTSIVTRVRPQAFRVGQSPERRSLVDWVRTLDVYPEPDAYTGQPVLAEGFVAYTTNLPDNYFTLTRFVITCCAADVYPVGLPVKLAQSRTTVPSDRWFAVKGKMVTETLNGKRQVVIQATSLNPIAEPKNPYSY